MHTEQFGTNIDEIWVNEFTEKSAQVFREQVISKCEENPSGVIQINIDSYGGSVDALVKMVETMNEMPNAFLTRISGKAMSCGAILASCGDVRFVGEYSSVMVHNISWGVGGDVTNLTSVADEAKRINENIMGLLADNCNMSYQDMQKAIRDTTNSKEIWMSAKDAVKFGICDFVGTPILTTITQTQLNHVQTKIRAEGVDLADFTDPNEIVEEPKPTKKKSTKKKSTKKKEGKRTTRVKKKR